ncbi:MAG: methionyl-tRNA formyltransferase, partial [Treponema sp.]
MPRLKVLYAGSPAASARTLERLVEYSASAECEFEVCGVLSNPPTAKGRSKTLTPTPVAETAARFGLPCLTPERLNADAREQAGALSPDILVCFAYGHIFGPKFLALFQFGGLNLHPSALPKYRGCTPVNAAILNRDTETAFTVQTLSLAMDEGDIIRQKKVPLTGAETAGSLLNAAAEDGAALLRDALSEIARTRQTPVGTPQTGEASYTTVIAKEDAKIDWTKSAEEIDAFVRAYSPEPCAWTTENGSALKILAGKAVVSASMPTGKAFFSQCGTVLRFDKTAGIIVQCGDGTYAVS